MQQLQEVPGKLELKSQPHIPEHQAVKFSKTSPTLTRKFTLNGHPMKWWHLQVAAGAAIAGARAMASMKHVGMNVAADALMTLAYTGIKGGLMIVIADDPNVHSSQNEQDSRNWARFGKDPDAGAGRCSGML